MSRLQRQRPPSARAAAAAAAAALIRLSLSSASALSSSPPLLDLASATSTNDDKDNLDSDRSNRHDDALLLSHMYRGARRHCHCHCHCDGGDDRAEHDVRVGGRRRCRSNDSSTGPALLASLPSVEASTMVAPPLTPMDLSWDDVGACSDAASSPRATTLTTLTTTTLRPPPKSTQPPPPLLSGPRQQCISPPSLPTPPPPPTEGQPSILRRRKSDGDGNGNGGIDDSFPSTFLCAHLAADLWDDWRPGTTANDGERIRMPQWNAWQQHQQSSHHHHSRHIHHLQSSRSRDRRKKGRIVLDLGGGGGERERKREKVGGNGIGGNEENDSAEVFGPSSPMLTSLRIPPPLPPLPPVPPDTALPRISGNRVKAGGGIGSIGTAKHTKTGTTIGPPSATFADVTSMNHSLLRISFDAPSLLRLLPLATSASALLGSAFMGTLRLLGPLILARRAVNFIGVLVCDYLRGRYFRRTYTRLERAYLRYYEAPALFRATCRTSAQIVVLFLLSSAMSWLVGVRHAPCRTEGRGLANFCGLLWIGAVVGTGHAFATAVAVWGGPLRIQADAHPGEGGGGHAMVGNGGGGGGSGGWNGGYGGGMSTGAEVGPEGDDENDEMAVKGGGRRSSGNDATTTTTMINSSGEHKLKKRRRRRTRAGGAAAAFSRPCRAMLGWMRNPEEWISSIGSRDDRKRIPPFRPIPIIFPMTWVPLRLLLICSIARVSSTEPTTYRWVPRHVDPIPNLVRQFLIQLALGDEWYRVFLGERRVGLGIFVLACHFVALFVTFVSAAMINGLAAMLMLPSLLAVVVSGWMNIVIFWNRLNERRRRRAFNALEEKKRQALSAFRSPLY